MLHNAVVAWNMVHIEPVVEQLRAEGQRCDDELLSLTTPLLRRHLNPFGRYYFDLVRMRQDGGQLVELAWEPSARTSWSLNGGFQLDVVSTRNIG